MRRRRVLAYSAATVGLLGYAWSENSTTGEMDSPLSTQTGKTNRTPAQGEQTASSVPTSSVGGSLNGRPRRIGDNLGLIEESNTTWLHAFLDVRKKYEQDANPRTDPDIEALRRVSQNTDVKLIVALKWNFTGNFGNVEVTRVPQSGSAHRNALFEYATELLTAIGGPIDIVVLGNEPIWEALDEDVLGSNPPLITFTRELRDHLVDNYTTGDPRFLVGAFNKLYSDYVRSEYGRFYEQLFNMARNSDDIDGIDLHVHYNGFQQAREILSIARNEIPDGTITVTEFSPVWRYEENADASIAASESGRQFANQYGIAPETTVTEYYRAVQENPRSPREIADFMEAMPWYNANFVEDMYDLLGEYGAEIGAFGFLQGAGFRHVELTDDWVPFQINFLFQHGVIDSEDGAHPHYLDDYRKRA